MSRSRSSFDLTGAIATATSLKPADAPPPSPYRGVNLVSFGGAPAPAPASVRPSALDASVPSPRPLGSPDHPSFEDSSISADATRRPPKLPDLSGIASPVTRCQMIIDWVVEATGASDVFIADSTGLPIAGATDEAEARLAGAGLVASSITQLAASIPGTASSLFELHVGEGPFFQLVGFHVEGALFLVGWSRATPLTFRQAHAIRLACRHALGDAGGPA